MVDHRHHLATTVAKGDRRDSLEALSVKLADRFDRAQPENSAGLARALVHVLAELDALEVPAASASDEVAAKRAARRAGTEVPDAAAVSGSGKSRGRGNRAGAKRRD